MPWDPHCSCQRTPSLGLCALNDGGECGHRGLPAPPALGRSLAQLLSHIQRCAPQRPGLFGSSLRELLCPALILGGRAGV